MSMYEPLPPVQELPPETGPDIRTRHLGGRALIAVVETSRMIDRAAYEMIALALFGEY
jgi:hypothetical protein